MTTPVDEEEVVVELRLQPVVARPDGWRGRSSGLIAAGLVGFIVVGLALGALGDGRPASSAAAVVPEPTTISTPRASRRPNPTPRPQLSPLPRVEVIGGEIPTERRLVYASGMQVLDLATGELTTPARPYEDLVVPLATGELVCACISRPVPAGVSTMSSVLLEFERFDASGTVLLERDVTTFDGIVEVPEMDLGFTMAAALSDDDRYLYVLTAARRPPVWAVELHQIDAGSGVLIGSTAVDELAIDPEEPGPPASAPPPTATPDGAPPEGLHVWTNALALSPDGAMMSATLAYSVVRGEVWTSGYRQYLVPLADGQPGAAVTLDEGTELDGWCVGPPEFVDDAMLVQVCLSPEGPRGPDVFYVRRVTTSGGAIDDVALRDTPWEVRYQLSTALDRGRRAVVSWDPVTHSVSRVSVDDGAVLTREVARAMLPDPPSDPGGGRGYFGADPGLVLSPDGLRLYAVGFALGPSDSGTPTGVWVFDAETLDLLDHWAPRALLTSLAVSADGRFVYAAGANGFDVEGNQAPWPGSVTVYDAQTGEIQVIYGAVSRDSWVNFRPVR